MAKPAAKTPAPKKPAAKKPPAKPAVNRPKSPAEWAHDRLVMYIRNFESQLDGQQEIAMGFASDETGVLRIEGLGYFEPDIITFYGRDEDGSKTQLIQHVTQLSVTLRAVPKEGKAEAPRRIGFQLNSGWIGGDSGDASVG
ncbi:DUF6173 family protein [Tabrizicola sp.]|uniref:DUF6173 family protein n=1 Tax=Tabrizicola sp. TaxID=2005166 RepID=UPI001A62F3A2|nr:DUF6173 family protein [Tabrizicola sp.]MBL9073937.1 hypothetical protein [Tabrizicola sp.]